MRDLHRCIECGFLSTERQAFVAGYSGALLCHSCAPGARVMGIKCVSDPATPRGQAELRDADGKTLVRIVNLAD